MHRKDVKNKPEPEYYVFPGGGREGNEDFEEGTKREIKEEFGIDVEIIEKVYEEESDIFNQKTIYYLCKYVSGEFGTGDGPEFNNDPKYADSGKYIPEIVKKEDLEKIPLMPPEIKEKFIKDVKNGRF
ncbi:MAG: NUDIX domain-containing protein [Clostridia bacterium]|nr:NUDIX domain-containing protein [Clostridia bacterium]